MMKIHCVFILLLCLTQKISQSMVIKQNKTAILKSNTENAKTQKLAPTELSAEDITTGTTGPTWAPTELSTEDTTPETTRPTWAPTELSTEDITKGTTGPTWAPTELSTETPESPTWTPTETVTWGPTWTPTGTVTWEPTWRTPPETVTWGPSSTTTGTVTWEPTWRTPTETWPTTETPTFPPMRLIICKNSDTAKDVENYGDLICSVNEDVAMSELPGIILTRDTVINYNDELDMFYEKTFAHASVSRVNVLNFGEEHAFTKSINIKNEYNGFFQQSSVSIHIKVPENKEVRMFVEIYGQEN